MNETRAPGLGVLWLSSRAAALLLCLVLAAHAGWANAQVNPEIANCEEIRDEATQTQVDFCTAHVGCALVMRIHKACVSAKSFLNRLKNFSFGKSEPDMNDVFEAAAPPVSDDPAYSRASSAIRSKYEGQPATVLRSGTTEKGASWVYQGPVVNGKWNGTGIYASSSGTIARAEYVDGRQVGKGEYTNTQRREVGDMQAYLLNGEGIRRYPDGSRYEGEFQKDMLHGQGTATYASGNRYVGAFEKGNRHGRGTFHFKSGGQVAGEFRDGKAFNAQETSADGRVLAVYSNGSKEAPSAGTGTGAAVGLGDFLEFLGTAIGVAREYRGSRRPSSGSGSSVGGGSSQDSGNSGCGPYGPGTCQ